MTDHQEHVAISGERADRAVAQVERSSKALRVLSALTSAAVLVAVVTFGLINLRQQADARTRFDRQQQNVLVILHRVQDATNPASAYSKANDARSQQIINLLIGCEENHTDRVAAHIVNSPVPPLAAGCPPDSLGS